MTLSIRSILCCAGGLVLAASVACAQTARTPVLVELFTSEGCSSCPPADALLAKLLQEQPVAAAEIIVLEEHVDYWEGLGWHDRFAARAFTERQSGYAQRLRTEGNYTPQMVVDGTDQFVGNDQGSALRSIARAARGAKAGLALTGIAVQAGRVSGQVEAVPAGTELFAALVEPMAMTNVRSGENGGRTLHHVSVVRAMQRVGAAKTAGPASFSVGLPKDAKVDGLRLVVFAQRPGQGAVVGAATAAVEQAAR